MWCWEFFVPVLWCWIVLFITFLPEENCKWICNKQIFVHSGVGLICKRNRIQVLQPSIWNPHSGGKEWDDDEEENTGRMKWKTLGAIRRCCWWQTKTSSVIGEKTAEQQASHFNSDAMQPQNALVTQNINDPTEKQTRWQWIRQSFEHWKKVVHMQFLLVVRILFSWCTQIECFGTRF